MEEKKEIKVRLSTVIYLTIIIALVVTLGVVYYFGFVVNKDKNVGEENFANTIENKVDKEIEKDITDVEEENQIATVLNNNTLDINSDKDKNTTNDSTQNTNITYTIDTRDESYAIIKATKDGKTFSKEFEMGAMIADTGIMELPTIGTVALVAESGGEAYIINIYQLIEDKIKLIGNIDCGLDMVEEATYTVETKNETIAIINAKRNDENITKEFEMSATIANTSVVDILKCGKVVLIAETGGEYYKINVYRLSQDYITGETKEIINVGSIDYIV